MFRQDNVSLVEFCEGGKSMFWPWRRHVVSCLVCSPGEHRGHYSRTTSDGGILHCGSRLRFVVLSSTLLRRSNQTSSFLRQTHGRTPSGVTRGSRGGRPPRAQVKMGAQNELTGTHFDIFCGVNGPQTGRKIRLRLLWCKLRKVAPNCDA